MVSSDMESLVDLAWNQNANTLQALNPSIFNTALSLTPALPLQTLCSRGPSASDTSFKFQSKGFPYAASYASTSLNTIGWSRKAAAHSSRGLANRPGASTLRNVSTSPKNSAKLFLSARSAVYVSGQNFSASRLLSLVFFCSGALTMPMAVTAAQAFSSAAVARSSAWLVVVASRWSSSCISCSWFACLVSSVAILTRSSSMLSNWSVE